MMSQRADSSIGFERIILLLMESGFTVPMQRPKVAYLIEKGCTSEQVSKVIARAQEERVAGKQVLVVRMNKNKKFQKEKLTAEGYKDIVEFYKRLIGGRLDRERHNTDKNVEKSGFMV